MSARAVAHFQRKNGMTVSSVLDLPTRQALGVA